MDPIHRRRWREFSLLFAVALASGCSPATSSTATRSTAATQAQGPSNVMTMLAPTDPQFNRPMGVTVDGSGNVYVADGSNAEIRKITPAGVVSTLAGSLPPNAWPWADNDADGIGAAARFYDVYGIAVDVSGNVYVTEYAGNTVRKITPDGVVSTIVGGQNGLCEWYLPLCRPEGIAVDGSGNVYVVTGYNAVKKFTPDGVESIVATTDGVARSVAVDGAGNVYLGDDYPRIQKVTPDGVVTMFVGMPTSEVGLAVDGSGNVYSAFGNLIYKMTPDGAVTSLAGSYCYSYQYPDQSCWADGMGSAAQFNDPSSVAVDGSGNLYVADLGNNSVRKVTPDGVVTTLAGTPPWGGSRDGTVTNLRLAHPNFVAVNGSGNAFVTDGDAIKKIALNGDASIFAGNALPGSADGTGSAARFNGAAGVALDQSGNLYVADSGNSTIRKITPAGVVSTFAGTAGVTGSADGTGSAARFSGPIGVAVDRSGNVYVADGSNFTIRKITPDGIVSTIAGTAGVMGTADGTGSAAQFGWPGGVSVDTAGNVYVTDTGNATIRKITAVGRVSTLAGTAGVSGSADGFGAAAQFTAPLGIVVDQNESIYVTDYATDTIRKITPAGAVSTVAGVSGQGTTVPGPLPASISQPFGIAIDPSTPGRFVVASPPSGVLNLFF